MKGGPRVPSKLPRKQTPSQMPPPSGENDSKKILRPQNSFQEMPYSSNSQPNSPVAPGLRTKKDKTQTEYSNLSEIELETGPNVADEEKEFSEKPRPSSSLQQKKGRGDASKSAPTTTEAEAPKNREESTSPKAPNRFKGQNPIQYGLWAHYAAIGAAFMCICMGSFAILWTDARTYGCRINGNLISNLFLFLPNGQCPTNYVTSTGKVNQVCCNFDTKSTLKGYKDIGIVYILYGVAMLFFENIDWGFGLWFPTDSIFYNLRISCIGVIHILTGIVGLYNYATCLAGSFLMITGAAYCYAVNRMEAGDGGREARRKASVAAQAKREKERQDKTLSMRTVENLQYVISFNPVSFCKRIYDEDKLSSYIWVGIYASLNIALFIYTLCMV
jgi:hypothetical protein